MDNKHKDKDMNNGNVERQCLNPKQEDKTMCGQKNSDTTIRVFNDSFGNLTIPVGDATVKVAFRMVDCQFHEFDNRPLEVGGLRKLKVLQMVEDLVAGGNLEKEANVFPSRTNPNFKFISLALDNTTYNIRGYVEGTEFKPSERTKRGDKWFDKSSVAVFVGDLRTQAFSAAKKELLSKPIERCLSRKEKAASDTTQQEVPEAPKTAFSG